MMKKAHEIVVVAVVGIQLEGWINFLFCVFQILAMQVFWLNREANHGQMIKT